MFFNSALGKQHSWPSMLQETQLIQMIHVGWVCVFDGMSQCTPSAWGSDGPLSQNTLPVPAFQTSTPLLSSSLIRLSEKQEWKRGSNKKRETAVLLFTLTLSPNSLGNVHEVRPDIAKHVKVCVVLTEWLMRADGRLELVLWKYNAWRHVDEMSYLHMWEFIQRQRNILKGCHLPNRLKEIHQLHIYYTSTSE